MREYTDLMEGNRDEVALEHSVAVVAALSPQPRSISATRNASSSDCWVFNRGSQAVS